MPDFFFFRNRRKKFDQALEEDNLSATLRAQCTVLKRCKCNNRLEKKILFDALFVTFTILKLFRKMCAFSGYFCTSSHFSINSNFPRPLKSFIHLFPSNSPHFGPLLTTQSPKRRKETKRKRPPSFKHTVLPKITSMYTNIHRN